MARNYKVNKFGKLFKNIEANSAAICTTQLELMEVQFDRHIKEGNDDNAIAIAQEYGEWLDESVEDMGFMYMAHLSKLID